MAELIRTPVRSGITRQLVNGAAAAAPASKADHRRDEQPGRPPEDAVSTSVSAGSAAVEEVAVGSVVKMPQPESVGLPKYDAETFTTMLMRANERADAAEQALNELKADIEKTREEAQSQGYADGLAKGRALADQELDTLRTEFHAVMDAAQGELAKLIENEEEDLVEIAYASVCRIIGRVALDKEAVAELVRTASRHVLQNQEMTVHLSEHDYRQLRGSVDSLLPGHAGARYQIVADNRIKMGGCILETGTGSLDARLEVQLQRLKEAFLATRAKSMAGD